MDRSQQFMKPPMSGRNADEDLQVFGADEARTRASYISSLSSLC